MAFTAQGNSAELFALAMNKLKYDICCGKCIFYVQKLDVQAIIVCTEKASRSLTGQQASKSAGLFRLFEGTVI